ncbi:MAG: LPS export ABC transporter ATP-binding protein [Methylovirgula sp.]
MHANSDEFSAAKSVARDRHGGVLGWLRAFFPRRRKAAKQKPQSQSDWLLGEDDPDFEIEQNWIARDLGHGREPGHPDDDLVGGATASAAPVLCPGPRPRTQPARTVLGGEGWLVAQHLHKTYKGRQVINDVSLMVRRGEAIALLGPNGAGKTTLFYMITGLVRPDGGTITLENYDVTSLPMYRRARLGIGYLPQEPSIFRGLNVEDNIRAVLEITQHDRRKRAEELEALLNEFNIARLRKSMAIALSGGERRRLEIARALAGHPSFMLLDEPFAGVDPLAVADIQDLVHHLKERGIGVLITDHNVRETLGLVDRAYIIHSGQLLTEGTPDEIVNNPDVRRLYLGEDFRL